MEHTSSWSRTRSLLGLTLLLCSSAFAQECNYEGSQREMNACAIEDYKKAFARYTAIYQARMAKIPPDAKRLFELESRQWSSVARKQCTHSSKGTGGDETILFYTCLQEVLEHRIHRLKNG